MEQRLTKADLNKIEHRIKYLRKIINREIPLKPGQMEWLNNPCNLSTNVMNTGGIFSKIGKGNYGTVFKVCIDDVCDNEFVLKEIKYRMETPDELSLDNPYKTENIEIEVFKLLNDLVYIGATPHIPLYMGDFICNIKGEKYRYLMVEKADKNLHDIIKKYPANIADIMKQSMFQLLYTFKIIQKRYDDFMHNDLKLNNILCNYPKDINNGKYYKYKLDGNVYYLPNGYQIFLWDFGLSSIICKRLSNILVEGLVEYSTVGVQNERNHYKDIYKILRGLEENKAYLDSETVAFARKYLYKNNGVYDEDEYWNLIPNIEPFTIDQMINDAYFDTFRSNNKVDISDDSIIDYYSDEHVHNMDLVRFQGISNLRFELRFNCQQYENKNIVYFVYKNPQYNDPYRSTCMVSSDSVILSVLDPDFKSVIAGKPVSNEDEYRSAIIEFGTKYIEGFHKIPLGGTIIKLINLYTDLMTNFVSRMYVTAEQRQMSTILRLVVLNKTVFMNMNRHYPVKKSIYGNMTASAKYLDYTIQFNEYLCKYY